MTVLTDKETNSPGFVHIFNFIKSSPSGYLEKGLANVMNTLCARVSTESYKDGFIANGLFREVDRNVGALLCLWMLRRTK